MIKKLSQLWPFLLFCILFIGIFYKIFFLAQFPFPGNLLVSWFFPYNSGGWEGYSSWTTYKEFIASDVIRQLFPWRSLAIELLKNRHLPLWNPYAFSGYPLAANLQTAAFYPLNFLFFLMEEKTAWIVYVLTQPILGFCFMYIFLRSIASSKYGAMLGSLAFGFVGYMAIWFEWGVVGHSAIWLPLALYGITKYVKTSSLRFLLLSSFAISFSVFAGHIQTTAYVIILTFIYYLFCMLSFNKKLISRLSGHFTILLGFGVAAIQLLPSYELLTFSARNQEASSRIFNQFKLPFSHLTTLFAPDFFGNPATKNFWGQNYPEFMVYAGIVILVFATISIFYQNRNAFVRFFIFIGALSLLFALSTPISNLLIILHIPILDTSIPSRSLFLFQFSLLVLASFGVSYFLEKKSFPIKAFLSLFLIYFLLWLFSIYSPVFLKDAGFAQFLSISKRNLIIPTLTFFVTAACIFIGTKKHSYKKALLVFIFILASFEYQYFLYKYSPFSPYNYFFPNHPLVNFLQDKSVPYRIFGYETAGLATNLPTQWRLYSPEGYDSLYIKRYGELLSEGKNKVLRSDALFSNSIPADDTYEKQVLMNLLGVKYVLDKDDLAPAVWSPQAWKFSENRFGLIYQNYKWKVYENRNALPKATIFYDFVVKDEKEILKTLFNKNFDYSKTLILEKLPALTKYDSKEIPTSAKILEYRPNTIIVEVDIKQKGLLFLADNFYPGWKAFVDNKSSPIYRADYTFRAILVPAGKHIVHLKYQPKSFSIGATITLLSLLACFSIFIKSRSQKSV